MISKLPYVPDDNCLSQRMNPPQASHAAYQEKSQSHCREVDLYPGSFALDQQHILVILEHFGVYDVVTRPFLPAGA